MLQLVRRVRQTAQATRYSSDGHPFPVHQWLWSIFANLVGLYR